MENKKKQLLDTMKALPMTMEDKCAFVDLISQNSSSGGTSQEDEYLYFDLRDVNHAMTKGLAVSCPHILVDIDNEVIEITSSKLFELYDDAVNKIVAIQAKRYIADVVVHSSGSIEYGKVDTINAMNIIGAKQITKEEYNSFITFAIDDFEETPIG